MHGHFIPHPTAPRDHFFPSVKSPSLTAAYAPAKKPMKLKPIVMIHGGSISDTTTMSMSRDSSTAPPNVPPSQKTIQTTRMSVVCRASFIAAPKEPVPGYTLKAALADPDLCRICGTQLSGNFARLAPKPSHFHVHPARRKQGEQTWHFAKCVTPWKTTSQRRRRCRGKSANSCGATL